MITLSQITDLSTLKEAKDALRAVLMQGAICPLCTQPAKMYTRSINSATAYNLYLIVTNFAVGEEFHMGNFLMKYNRQVGDTAKLCFWQFLEKVEGKLPDGNPANGMYRLTVGGKKFLTDPTIVVPKYVKIFHAEDYGFVEDEYMTIKDCFASKFNYNDLMNNVSK